jgi:hypothetical protein
MKRIAVVLGLLILVLGGAGNWMIWQQKKEEERARAAEIKRVSDEAEAKAQAEARAAAKAVAAKQKALEAESLPRRSQVAPLDGPDGEHFRFVHYAGDRVGYEYGSQDKRPPLYSQLLCDDGIIQPLSFDYGWIRPGSESYDFYKVPTANSVPDQICLSFRKKDAATFNPLFTTRKGDNASLTTGSCSPADQFPSDFIFQLGQGHARIQLIGLGCRTHLAPAFVFFASSLDSSYITGEVLTLLGGDTTAG